MPTEEHVLWTAHVAKVYLDHGWTSCVGAATAKPRLDVVVRNAIESGLIKGPRYLAASQEITVAGGLGDETLPHIPYPEYSFGQIVSGPEEMRKCVRMFLKYGVDSIKLNLSGDNFVPGADANTTWMSDEEVAMAVREAKIRGKRVSVHARSCASVKQAVRHGCEVIYHASYTDEEALDLLEQHRDKVFVAPGLSVIIKLLYEGEIVGISHQKAKDMGYELELEAAVKSLQAMHKRGVRVLPGGDYGFSWAPHGTNAMDLQYLVKYVGMTPMEALQSATRLRRPDHDARQRPGPGEGRLPRRPAAGGRRSGGEPRRAAREGSAARDHEGRRVPQGTRGAGGEPVAMVCRRRERPALSMRACRSPTLTFPRQSRGRGCTHPSPGVAGGRSGWGRSTPSPGCAGGGLGWGQP